MAGNSLLNAIFKPTPYSNRVIKLGANASDSVPKTTDPSIWINSREQPLNQVGSFITNTDSGVSLTNLPQTYLYKELEYLGYGGGIALPESVSEIDSTKFYLNGYATIDGVPQPYLMYVSSGYATHLEYFKADGTSLGKVTDFGYYGGAGRLFATAYCGKIYDDGTFTGQVILMSPHYNVGIPSGKIFEYNTGRGYDITRGQLIPTPIIDDLYEYLPIEPEGGTMDPGDGSFDSTSDPVAFPGLPSISALDTGMCAMYEMSGSQLRVLSGYLWSSAFDLDTFKKMFNDPMEAILNLAIMPIEFTGLLPATIKIGNVLTSATGNALSTPYKIIDFGTINLLEYWGGFADYSPYTKLSIFLPYVGVQNISIDDVMNGAIHLKAYCDCLTGSIQYMLYSNQNNHRGHNHASVLYTWGGNMQYQVPLTASNFSSVVSSLIGAGASIAGGIGAAVATGGVTTPIAIGTASATISNVMNAKTHIQRGGGIGGAVGLFGVQTPYLILERPEQVYPENYGHTVGVPNPVTDYLKNYTGFVKVEGVHLEIPNATENEINDIEQMLKDGVII